MFQSFFTGLSGMFSFSKSLDNVSNNIANMNTPGFRGTNTFLQSVSSDGDQGVGTKVQGTSSRLESGEIRQTGSSTDLAIAGKGMFILRDQGGELFYTRAGQFAIGSENILLDNNTGMEVMSISESGNLERVDVTDSRILPAEATTQIDFRGNLSSSDNEFEVSPVTVIDAGGDSHNLTLEFENPATSTDTWNISVLNSDGDILVSDEIQFDATGAPLAGFNTFDADLELGGEIQTVSFNFGEPGSFSGATQLSGSSSSLGVGEIDGNGVLGLARVGFDESGVMELQYSNGTTLEGPQIALANFDNDSSLSSVSGSLYRSNTNSTPDYGRPTEGALGSIEAGSIELSNVDLTQEFADMMIIQRGYQASSRAMSVANELLEQLYNTTRG